MAKMFKWRGPTLQKIFRKLEKKNMDMIKIPLRESAKLVQKQAKDDAPVVTGAYKKAIKRSVRTNRRSGFAFAKVGIKRGDPVMKYAGNVEQKHYTFTILEKTQEKPVRALFNQGLNKFFNRLRIR